MSFSGLSAGPRLNYRQNSVVVVPAALLPGCTRRKIIFCRQQQFRCELFRDIIVIAEVNPTELEHRVLGRIPGILITTAPVNESAWVL